MTNKEYSIIGLKDLLNDLENLSKALISIDCVTEHVSLSAHEELKADLHNLIKETNAYCQEITILN